MQKTLYGIGNLRAALEELNIRKPFLVCGKSFLGTPVKEAVDALKALYANVLVK